VVVARRRFAAFGLWGLMLTGFGCAVLFDIRADGGRLVDDGAGLMLPAIGVAFGTVGLLLALRVPENRMGWVFLAGGALIAIYAAAYQYFFWGVVQDWPLVWVAGWLNFAVYFPAILALIALPLLLFPNGRLPSRRWRWVMWAVIVFASLSIVFPTISPSFTDELGARSAADVPVEYLGTEDGEIVVEVDNPFGVNALSDFDSPVLFATFLLLLSLSFLGSAAAMVFRFRRSEGTERLQIKWLAFSASIAAVGLGSFYVIQGNSPDAPVLDFLVLLGLLGVLGIPVTAGIAVSRYRLYDIDRLISRTVSYTLLVGTLGLIYVIGAVWLPTRLLGGQSTLYVAGSTLAVAALFNPLRRRVQRAVDRQFNRSSYRAALISEEFSAKLQESLTIAELTGAWVQTVDDALQPKASGIWINSHQIDRTTRP